MFCWKLALYLSFCISDAEKRLSNRPAQIADSRADLVWCCRRHDGHPCNFCQKPLGEPRGTTLIKTNMSDDFEVFLSFDVGEVLSPIAGNLTHPNSQIIERIWSGVVDDMMDIHATSVKNYWANHSAET